MVSAFDGRVAAPDPRLHLSTCPAPAIAALLTCEPPRRVAALDVLRTDDGHHYGQEDAITPGSATPTLARTQGIILIGELHTRKRRVLRWLLWGTVVTLLSTRSRPIGSRHQEV